MKEIFYRSTNLTTEKTIFLHIFLIINFGHKLPETFLQINHHFTLESFLKVP